MIKEEGLKEKFVRRGFWIYLFSFILGPIGYATRVLLSADLTVDQMGILYGVIGLITLIGTYNDLGLTEALHYFLPKYAVAKEYGRFKSALVYTISMQLSTSVVLGSALYFFSQPIALGYFKNGEATEVLQIFCLFFLLSNLLQISSSVFSSLQETKYQYFQNFIRSTLALAFVAGLWKFGAGSLANYSWAWVIPLGFTIIWAFVVFYWKFYRVYLRGVPFVFEKTEFVAIFKYAMLVLLTANVGVVLSQIDMQLIIVILWTTAAGYYTNYLSLIGIPFLLVTPIIGFLYPVISSLSGHGWEEKITAIRWFFTKYFAAAAISCSVALGFFWMDFAIAFFGSKFAESGKILAWSAPFLIFNFLLQINFQILWGTWRLKERLKILAIGLAFNIPLNLALIPVMGVSGSALAVGLSWVPMWYLTERKCSRYRIGYDWKFFGKNLFWAAVTTGLLLISRTQIADYLPDSERLASLIRLSFLSIVYIIVFAIVNRSETLELVKELKSMLSKKKAVAPETVPTPES